MSTETPAVVLIVEDQEPMRAALRDFVAAEFPAWQVFEAADGASALRLFHERAPRLVLMDVCLPDINGIELTRRMKVLVPATIVVVMSVLSGAHVAEQAVAAGAALFIAKDCLSSELAPFIARLQTGT